MDEKYFKFDQEGYDNYSPMYMSIIISFGFANIFASITHVTLYYGKSIWSQFRDAPGNGNTRDIHNKLMKNYKSVPQHWFFAILISLVILAMFTVEVFGGELQLPFWGVLLASVVVLIFLLPLSVLIATASQVVSTMVSCFVHFCTIWWLFSTVEHICDPTKLPLGSPWTCPRENLIFNRTSVWGLVGPSLMFAPFGIYSNMYFFLIGTLATILVWVFSRMFPEKKWVQLINV